MIIINKATQKQTVAAIKSGDFSEVEKIEESFSCGRFRFCAADLVRIAAGAVSVWGAVCHAVRPASVNKAGRIFAAVLHGVEERADHPDF